MITSYLISYHLTRPLVHLTPLLRHLDCYPLDPFPIPRPLDLQYPFLCISISII